MAKKSAAKPAELGSARRDDQTTHRDVPTTKLKPSALLDTRVLKKTGSFYYHCDWHASHYVKVMPDQIFWENN